MKALRNYLDKIKPNFEEGGKLHAFRSVFDGFETFLFVPNSTSKTGVHIHDAIDSKRIMSMVVIALIPALLFGMYNVGYQHFLAEARRQVSLKSLFMVSWQFCLRLLYHTSVWESNLWWHNGRTKKFRKVSWYPVC